MTRKEIKISQDLQRHAPGHFSVVVTVVEDEFELSKEYTYYKTNKAYPIYKSLIATLRDYQDVDVTLIMANRYIAAEINSVHESEGALGKMLSEILTKNNLTIKAV